VITIQLFTLANIDVTSVFPTEEDGSFELSQWIPKTEDQKYFWIVTLICGVVIIFPTGSLLERVSEQYTLTNKELSSDKFDVDDTQQVAPPTSGKQP